MRHIDLKKTFHDKAYPEPNTGCWLWIGSGDKNGYGRIKINRKNIQAHRLSYQLFKGDIPNSMLICHTCDVPACVNPDHLFLGTAKENSQDSVKKGRDFRGKRNAKLSKEQVLIIRQIRTSTNHTYAEIAEKFGVTIAAVTDVCLKRNWKHV